MSGIRFFASRLTFHVSRFTFYAPRTTRYVILAILSILLLLGFWIFLSPRDDGSLTEIRRRGVLRVGLDASFPPFETMDATGQIIGLDVDIAQAVAADLGVKVELVNIGFDGLYDALLARRVDLVISGLPYDPLRTQDVAYTVNYFNAGQVLVTRSDENAIKTVEALANRIVAVEWGSQAEMEARGLQNPPSPRGRGDRGEGFSLLRQDSADAALNAVRNGQADAAIVDAPSALSGDGGLKIVTYLTDEWYAAAVHWQSRELLVAVNQSLTRLQTSGEMARLQARWFQRE